MLTLSDTYIYWKWVVYNLFVVISTKVIATLIGVRRTVFMAGFVNRSKAITKVVPLVNVSKLLTRM